MMNDSASNSYKYVPVTAADTDALLRISIKSGELMVSDEGFHPECTESGSWRRLIKE